MHFGGLVALADMNFVVNEGEVVGLIGPNGAGKTTAFNVVTGFLRPTRGEVRYRGTSLNNLKPHEVTSLGLAGRSSPRKPGSRGSGSTCGGGGGGGVPGPGGGGAGGGVVPCEGGCWESGAGVAGDPPDSGLGCAFCGATPGGR